MGQLGRQSIFSFFSSYAGIVLGMLNKVLLFPIVFYEHEEYWALLELYVAYASIISTMAHFGMPRVLQRFYPGMEEEDKPRFLGYTLIYTLIGSVLIGFLMYFLQDPISRWATDGSAEFSFFREHYVLLLVLTTVMVFFDYLGGILISNFRSHLPIFLNSVSLRIGVSLCIAAFYIFGFSREVFMYLFISVYLVNVFIAGIYLFRKKLLHFTFRGTIEKQGYLQFGMFSVMAGTSGWLLNFMDTLFVGKYFFAQVTLLVVAKYIANIVHMPARAVVQASVPVISRAWKLNDKEQLGLIYRKTALTELLVGGLIFLVIWINIDLFLTFFRNPEYRGIKYVFLVFALGRLVDLSTGSNSAIISNSHHYRFSLYANIGLVITAVLLNFWLTPVYGIIGAAAALSIAITINNIAMVYYLWVKEHIQPFTKVHLLVLGFFAIVVTLLSNPFEMPLWADLIIRNGAFAAGTWVLIFYFKPVQEINTLFESMWQRVSRR
ncbi:MAG: lipopolysaccharide biosynthesis protein [Owenweeksia sp.]